MPYKAVCLPFFSISQDFYKVLVSRCYFLSARAVVSLLARAFFFFYFSFFLRYRYNFASSTIFLLNNIKATFSSFTLAF